jgi:feruloyl esterase
MEGVAYACADDTASALQCMAMTSGDGKTPGAWAALVTAADPGFTGARPRVQIWHGSADHTVSVQNASELVKQWTAVDGVDQTATATDTIEGATRTQYGAGVVEEYLVSGMDHAVAIGDDALGTCPGTAGSYFSDQGICSTLRAAEFFGVLADTGGGSDSGSGSNPGGGGGSGPDAGGGGPDPADPAGGCDAGGTSGPFALVLAALALAARRLRRLRLAGSICKNAP